MAKINHKWLHKVAEERKLNTEKMIHLDLSSQKKPNYGGSKNLILIQDSQTKQKWSFFTKTKEKLTEKVTPYLNKIKTMRENFKTNFL